MPSGHVDTGSETKRKGQIDLLCDVHRPRKIDPLEGVLVAEKGRGPLDQLLVAVVVGAALAQVGRGRVALQMTARDEVGWEVVGACGCDGRKMGQLVYALFLFFVFFGEGALRLCEVLGVEVRVS